MRKLFIIFSIAITAIFSMPQQSHAHCEIPCGIYADSLRMVQINEHIATIEKIQEIATQYFMYQRIKFDKDGKLDKKNQRSLAIMHKICVYAMKCKQTTNIKYVDALRDSVHDFAHVYFPSHKH